LTKQLSGRPVIPHQSYNDKVACLKRAAKDIPLLVKLLLIILRTQSYLAVTKEAMKWLQQLPLPNNIRQLKML